MTTIAERMGYASDAGYDFAETAMVQLFMLADIPLGVSDNAAAKRYPALIAALIDAAVKVYAAERQYESAERIADALNGIAAAIRESKGCQS